MKIHPYISTDDGALCLSREGLGDAIVDRIQTETKDYIVNPRKVGDAIRSGTPLLIPEQVGQRENSAHLAVYGAVYGHPDKPDGEKLTSAHITGFVLDTGETVLTPLGQKRAQRTITGQGMAQLLVNAAQGRGPGGMS